MLTKSTKITKLHFAIRELTVCELQIVRRLKMRMKIDFCFISLFSFHPSCFNHQKDISIVLSDINDHHLVNHHQLSEIF